MTGFKVTLVGSCGGIGQPLSMLLKLNPNVTELSVCDLESCNPHGIATDLSHIPSPSKVKSYVNPDQLTDAVRDSDVIIVTAGFHQHPEKPSEDPFTVNAKIMKDIAEVCCKNPRAMVLIVTHPLNSMVPLFSEVYKKAGTYDPRRIVGVTASDVAKAITSYSEKTGQDASKVNVPVVGGHDYETTVPLFSQATPRADLSPSDVQSLTKCCQMAGTEVTKAKGGRTSATLSTAWATNNFLNVVLQGLSGQKSTACAYVDCGDGQFFAGPVEFDGNGASRMLPIPDSITEFERQMINKSKEELKKNIKNGATFITPEWSPEKQRESKGIPGEKIPTGRKEMGA
jgi:malate dehydrogenase